MSQPSALCSFRQLTTDERDIVWRFRYSLTQEPRALTKFLKCVDWKDVQEARQATELMKMGVWKQDIDVADALELLSPDFSDEAVGACLKSRTLGRAGIALAQAAQRAAYCFRAY